MDKSISVSSIRLLIDKQNALKSNAVRCPHCGHIHSATICPICKRAKWEKPTNN